MTSPEPTTPRSPLRRLLAILLWPARAVLAPFRWLGARWRDLRGFFTDVPEDVSLTETLGDALESRESLFETFSGIGEHIDALRRHLLRSVLALAITTAVSFLFAERFMDYLARPLPGGLASLQTIEPTESVGVFMRVALLSGVALAMPWIISELYLFTAPGLMPRSRVMLLVAIPAASALFIIGLLFTYFVMLPPAIGFLLEFGQFQSAWRPSAYFGLVTNLMFWIGIAFQMPLVVYALAAVGLIRARQLARGWRLAIVVTAIVAAAVTPTIDPVNMALVMLPMLGLYAFSILGAAVAGASHERDRRARQQAADARAAR
jgi:sec-independent protein translocase protein TatC